MQTRWIALFVLTAARVSMALQFQSFASVAPLLDRDLVIGYANIGFLIGLCMLPGIVLALPGGLLGRRFGDKRMVIAGLILMEFGGVLTGFDGNYATLLAGRLLSGIGGVLLNALMSRMITDWFAGREIVLAMTIFINSFPIGIGIGLLLVPSLEPLPPLLAIGALVGLPVGVIMSLPADVLRPENRAAGMGLFYTCLYIGHTGLPPLAGKIQDAMGGTAASLYFAAALVFAIVPIFALFRAVQRRCAKAASI
ncbi:MAG: MFS transporter [Proteobacteria bacterium]|nr:MFS transporter [Pseudomonadota bacterium]